MTNKKVVNLKLTAEHAKFLYTTLGMLSDPHDVDYKIYNEIQDDLRKEMDKKGVSDD